MALQYVTVSEKDLGGGIDSRSSENLIPAGFFEDALNADLIETRIAKRKGYQQQAGWLPLRVVNIDYSSDLTDNVTFTLDASIDLSNITSSPLIVLGSTSAENNTNNAGAFGTSTESIRYINSFKANPRITFPAPNSTQTIAADSHGLSTNLFFIGATQSLSATNFSHSVFTPDAIRINTTDLSVEIDTTNASTFDGFIYFADRASVPGKNYAHTNTIIAPSITTTITIPANVHNLDNFNIIAKVFEINGIYHNEIIPDQVILNPLTGSIAVTITNSSANPITVFPVLSVPLPTNLRVGSVNGNATTTITIPFFDGKFPFTSIYLEQTPGGILEQVLADSIEYDSNSNTLTITLTNNSPTSANFEVYYDYGFILGNKLIASLDPILLADEYSDNNPQLTIWGLDHNLIYSNRDAKQGWVTHLDTYKRAATERLLAAMGGVLHAEYFFNEVADQYLYAQLYPNSANRVDLDQNLNYAFHKTGDAVLRSRGHLKADNVITGLAEIASITWNSSTGYTTYRLNVQNKQILDSTNTPTALSSIISATPNLEEYLTVRDTGWKRHNGVFKIKQVVDVDAHHIDIIVDNPMLMCSDFDETESGGYAGIFTDIINLTSPSEFVPKDTITSSVFGDEFIIDVLSSLGSAVVVSGVVDHISLPNGLRLQGNRISSLIPLRNALDVGSVENIVLGDMLQYPDYERLFKVKNIITIDTDTVTITSNGTYLTVVLATESTQNIRAGQKILLTEALFLTGEHEVFDVIDSSTFRIESTYSGSPISGNIIGKCIEIDEAISWADLPDNTKSFTVTSRWIPVEQPSIDLEKKSRYFDILGASLQPFIRSTTVNDTMFFTNGEDEVLKFDGQNVYRAGLFRWQPGLFTTLNNSLPGKIVTNNPSSVVSNVNDNTFTITTGEEAKFQIGQRIRHDDGTTIVDYTITDLDNNKVIVNSLISGASSGTITKISTFRYYFRLNAIDANNNIVASAVAGSENFRVEVAESTAIFLQLVGMPKWGNYDYKRIEVEIYRTPADINATFYKITNLPIKFDEASGYLTFIDTVSDEELQDQSQFDPLTSFDVELANLVRLSEPLRAKYITSAGNRLILGNVTDYPELDIQLFDQSRIADTADLHQFIWSFRKDSLLTGAITSTDMYSTVRYEWLDLANVSPSTISGTVLDSVNSEVDVTIGAHSLVAGNWVYIYNLDKGSNHTTHICGWHQIISITGTTITIKYANIGTEVITANRLITATNANDIPVLLGMDGNRHTKSDRIAEQLRVTNSAVYRLSEAINCSMRVCQLAEFEPWMIASSGGEYASGQLIVRKPRADQYIPEVVLPATIPAAFDVFINGLRRTQSTETAMIEKTYPSRIIESYPNLPEVFMAPTAIVDTASKLIRDINSSDGQQLSGILPFFSDSTTSDSSKESIVLAFKTNSVYAYNVNSEAAPQKLDTQGLGCTAPYSIASINGAILFANESGIYGITRDLNMLYVGKPMERKWATVNKSFLENCHGHNFGLSRQYKLSVPTSAKEPNQVFVFDYESSTAKQSDMIRGWTRYDSHFALGWANKANNAFFATGKGSVMALRQTGTASDYRDDNQAINWQVDYRPMDLGDSGSRKAILSIISHIRHLTDQTGTYLKVAVDLNRSFDSTDRVSIEYIEPITGLSDIINPAIIPFRSSIDRRKFLWLQLRYGNDALDEACELAGIDLRASLLNSKGIREAKD